MKKENLRSLMLCMFILLLSATMLGQTSTMNELPSEINQLAPPDAANQKKDNKRKDEFKIYGGVNFNNLNLSSGNYGTTTGVGWLLGASYKRGKFLYWEVGAKYSNPVYNIDNTLLPDSTGLFDGIFSVRSVDIPVTLGINFLWFTSRIIGLRIYVSAVPSFALGIGSNDLDIAMEDINTFNFYGIGGIGVDVAFIFVETGINYGFNDMFNNYSTSNPYQLFVNLGFRF
jgi:hypothetical protein